MRIDWALQGSQRQAAGVEGWVYSTINHSPDWNREENEQAAIGFEPFDENAAAVIGRKRKKNSSDNLAKIVTALEDGEHSQIELKSKVVKYFGWLQQAAVVEDLEGLR